MTTWGRSRSTVTDDPYWTALVVAVLAMLLAVVGLDRATEGLDRPRVITGTVTADDPESAATTTSVPDGDR